MWTGIPPHDHQTRAYPSLCSMELLHAQVFLLPPFEGMLVHTITKLAQAIDVHVMRAR